MATDRTDAHGKKRKKGPVFFIILGIVLLVLVLVLPDIIYNIRTKLHPDSKGGIAAKEYVEMVLISIEICSTGILSYVAYCLSKSLGKITLNERKAKITLWATRIDREIRNNSVLILNKYSNLGANLDELYILESSLADIINLNTEQKITAPERDLLTNYLNKISKIKKMHQKGEDTTDQLKEYVQKFLDTSETPQLKFESSMENLLENLKRYSKGEE